VSVNINALKEIQSRSKSGWLKKGHVRKRYGEDGEREVGRYSFFVFAFEILNDVGNEMRDRKDYCIGNLRNSTRNPVDCKVK
jgi:hypothetical protein